jgi:1,4-dihydroxy-2-naphthoate octaprenyltransferase
MSSLKNWTFAARPKTLPAAVVPVAVGGAMAAATGSFLLAPWAICLVFALMIQIGTNFANDYYDFVKGADDDRRIGPERAVASGWITPGQMKLGMILFFAAAFIIGCLLINWGGWWLVLVGVASIICGVAYTGGPYPLGYNGLGDLFVLFFFGWVATGVTYYAQAGSFAFPLMNENSAVWTLLAGLVPGALATNLLVVNNVRDAPLDAEAGKRTLVVRMGRNWGLGEYAALSAVSFLIPIGFAFAGDYYGCCLVVLCLPLAVRTNKRLVRAQDRADYSKALQKTALQLVLTGGFFALGLAMGPF